MGKQGKKFSKKKIAAVVGISVLAALAIGVNAVCFSMSDILNTWAVIGGSALDQKTNGEGKDLARSIEREGAVLVENKDDSLPLNKDSTNKVNVFGWSSSQWIYSGSGSGRTNGLNEQTDLITALNDYATITSSDSSISSGFAPISSRYFSRFSYRLEYRSSHSSPAGVNSSDSVRIPLSMQFLK